MKVTFEPAARDELDDIFAWIAKDNPRAALEMITRIEEKVMRLGSPELAHMGRPGLVEGTRELIEWPYIIVCTRWVQTKTRSSLFPSCTGLKIARVWHDSDSTKIGGKSCLRSCARRD
jgi:plasmid stabilization system protein ParE